MSALGQKRRTCSPNGPCRARPMLARSNEWCRQILSAAWHVCVHAMRHVGPLKAHAVAWRWCLTAKKWRPVVIKVPENRGDIDCPGLHVSETCSPKEICQPFRMAHRKSAAFIERSSALVHGDRSVAEMTHHLHFAGVIPNVGRDDAVGARYSLHFANRFFLIGNKIDNKTGHSRVERGISNQQFLRVTNLKDHTRIGHFVTRVRDKAI